MPFGRGRSLFSGIGPKMDMVVGGWEFRGTARLQSGNLLDFKNRVLVGMTDQELRDSVGVWFDNATKIAYYIPKDIVDESYKAYQYDASGFTSGAPAGRYAAPAGSVGGGNCVQRCRRLCTAAPLFPRADVHEIRPEPGEADPVQRAEEL